MYAPTRACVRCIKVFNIFALLYNRKCYLIHKTYRRKARTYHNVSRTLPLVVRYVPGRTEYDDQIWSAAEERRRCCRVLWYAFGRHVPWLCRVWKYLLYRVRCGGFYVWTTSVVNIILLTVFLCYMHTYVFIVLDLLAQKKNICYVL